MLKMFWPRYFDKDSGKWIQVQNRTCFSKGDVRDACELCGWGRHMAIHCKPEGSPPTGLMGLHGWARREPPNVRVKPAPTVGR